MQPMNWSGRDHQCAPMFSVSQAVRLPRRTHRLSIYLCLLQLILLLLLLLLIIGDCFHFAAAQLIFHIYNPSTESRLKFSPSQSVTHLLTHSQSGEDYKSHNPKLLCYCCCHDRHHHHHPFEWCILNTQSVVRSPLTRS